jgi:ABC-2 type transport system permease protein
MEMAGGRIWVALVGKLLPHTLLFLTIAFVYSWYAYGVMGFPHPGGLPKILLLCFLMVLAAQGFGIFAFGLFPSLRLSMSICSLWAVLSFSMAGSAFPVMGMDAPLKALSWLFPLRHYYMIYQLTVLNGFSLLDAWWHVACLIGFMLLPIALAPKIKNAMLTYVYIP